jgi:hypothetical protein
MRLYRSGAYTISIHRAKMQQPEIDKINSNSVTVKYGLHKPLAPALGRTKASPEITEMRVRLLGIEMRPHIHITKRTPQRRNTLSSMCVYAACVYTACWVDFG